MELQHEKGSIDKRQDVESGSFQQGFEEHVEKQKNWDNLGSGYDEYVRNEAELLHYKFIAQEPSLGIHFLADFREQVLGIESLENKAEQISENVTSLKRKRRTGSLETSTFNCQYCTKAFNQRSQLDLHYLKHHKHQIKDIETFLNSKIYSCEICPYETILLHDLKRHMLVHERNAEEITKSSDQGIETVNSPMLPIPNVNSEVSIVPQLQMIPRQKLLKTIEKFTCLLCKQSFDIRKRLNAHLLKEHRDEMKKLNNAPRFKVHTCPICEYETTHSHNFKKHMEVHDKNSKVRKRRDVPKPEELQKSEEDVSEDEEDKLHSCPLCIYQTTESSELKKHLLVHTQNSETEENFQCDQCDYQSTKKLRFLKHLLVHTDVKPYECVACEKGFIKKIQLESHILTQHKDDENLIRCISSKIHYCNDCSYKTVVVQMMKNHVKNKHGEGKSSE